MRDDASLAWQSSGHYFRRVTIFVCTRASNILVVVIAEVFLTDRPLCHDCILQVLHHLVLRSRLHLEGADTSLLFEKFCLLLLESIDSLLQALVIQSHLLGFCLELGDFLLAKAQQVFVTLEFELALTLFFLFTLDLFLQLFFLVFKLVLHALNVQLQLLLDLNMISNLCLVLLQH